MLPRAARRALAAPSAAALLQRCSTSVLLSIDLAATRRPPSLARGGLFASSVRSSSSSSSSSSPPPPEMLPEKRTTVAFIGLGNMGLPMAANLLLRGGYNIVACDVSDANVSRLEEEAAAAAAAATSSRRPPPPAVWRAATPRAAAAHPAVSAVVTMLPATAHARQVYEDPHDGVLAGLAGDDGPGRRSPVLLCDCSTVSPSFAAALAEKVPPPHLLVDAPVSGGVPAARAGTLTFMVGGPEAAFSRAQRLLLTLMGARSVRCGQRNGAGQAAKVANNLALAVQYAAVCEALALGARCGVDPLLLSNEVFAHSSADCWAVRKYSPVPGAVEGAPAGNGYRAGFGAPLMVKDLAIAIELADELGAPRPMAEAAKGLYERVVAAAQARGQDAREVDFSALYRDVYSNGGGGGGGRRA